MKMLFHLSVVSLGPVIACTTLPKDKVVRTIDLTHRTLSISWNDYIELFEEI